jgi:hypothetical protein
MKSFGATLVETLVVGGGGGGGGGFNDDAAGGGGGGGAFLPGSLVLTGTTSYGVTVGGSGTAGSGSSNVRGGNGGDSIFSTVTANGGAGGGTYSGFGDMGMNGISNGNASGSGGGGAGTNTNPGGTGGVYGSSGGSHTGTGQSNNSTSCGGGGGAGGIGSNGVANSTGGNGGIGKSSSISGALVYYAGGGAGGSSQGATGGGGLGGGGDRGAPGSGDGNGNNGFSGIANTGGGGGGASAGNTTVSGGTGGSGIVIIKYPGPQKATGGTITSVNGYTIHTFTASGTFTTGAIWADLAVTNVGTLTNGPTYSSINGGCVVFDGINDYVSVPDNPAWAFGTNSFTILIWYARNSSGSLYLMSTISGGYNGFQFYTNSSYLTFGGYNGAGGTSATKAFTADSSWHLATVVGNSGVVTVYNDMIPGTGVAMTIGNSTQTLQIGIDWDLLSSPFNGKISTVQIYNRALSLAEITQNFQASRGRYGI